MCHSDWAGAGRAHCPVSVFPEDMGTCLRNMVVERPESHLAVSAVPWARGAKLDRDTKSQLSPNTAEAGGKPLGLAAPPQHRR
jgi:hypothetical protein